MEITMKKQPIRLPRLISDGMVLQRGEKTNIWGWADPEEEITLKFMQKQWHTTVDAVGKWSVVLEKLVVGGPYDMEIQTSFGENRVVRDILIGDVWICSGQSNIELPMDRVKDQFLEDVKICENPFIRLFKIQEHYDFHGPIEELSSGTWEAASCENILRFSALSYYFEKFMQESTGVPIGVINASLGGSPIEAWMSEEMLEAFEGYDKVIAKYRDDDFIKKALKEEEKVPTDWHKELTHMDLGLKGENPWYAVNVEDEAWEEMRLPTFFDKEGLKNFNGAIWFRKKVNVPQSMMGKNAKLWLGTIVDSDETYWNGIQIGSTGYKYPPRKYEVPSELLKEGENTLAIRIVCNKGLGRFTPDKVYRLFNDQEGVELTGVWKYKIGATTSPLEDTSFVRWKPTGLYNGMLAPCHLYTIRGFLWYQGESNTKAPKGYEKLFEKMIVSWRSKWGQGDLPFIYVQLPNFEIDLQEDGSWPKLREAQRQTLKVPNTAMVVAIDVGEANDLHPLNKKDLGYRASLAARALALGEEIEYSGPVLEEASVCNGQVVLRFSRAIGGLKTGDGEALKHFEIAGDDQIFVQAKAQIKESEVILWHEDILAPAAIRYAYVNNPIGGLLYNQQGLPASPFFIDL
jgi:sialate O-acetylesterase